MAETQQRSGFAKKVWDCGVPGDRCTGRTQNLLTNKSARGKGLKSHGSFEEARKCQKRDEAAQNANSIANGGRIWYGKPRPYKPGKNSKFVMAPKFRG